jgi:hypothetical protein
MSCASFPMPRAVCASSALALETHETWREASRYLNMNALKEHEKLTLKAAA